jgi:exopolysaccharide biosynthesis polyprenyl glycosylphosphotransferase
VHTFVYLGGDLLAVALAHALAALVVALFLRMPASALDPPADYRYYIPFFAVMLCLFGGYKSPELRRPEQELERSCKAVAVTFLGLVPFHLVVFGSEVFSRCLLIAWFAFSCVLLTATRFTLRAFYGQLWKAGRCRRKALLLGSPAGILEYQQLLAIQRHHGYDLVGAVVNSAASPALAEAVMCLPVLGSLDRWEQALEDAEARVLIVAYSAVPHGEVWLGELLRRCKQRRVDVELYSTVLASANMNYDRDEVTGCFRLCARPEWSLAVQRIVKRAMDLGIGFIGSGVTLLLTPIVFVLVNLEDPGPVFHSREFVGSDGRIRYYRKFRTMLKDADGILHRDPELKARFVRQYKLRDDPRLLRVGRFMRRYSLDEFPQFFSVLSGNLTFVGPRVISDEEKRLYGPLLPKLLCCKPGLTGFWQVMGRQTTTYAERVQMDMFYIDRWSIWLDLVIIAKTFWKVLRAEGAY